MKTLDRKGLLAIKVDLPQQTVEIPEWGASIIVRGMTGKDQSTLFRAAQKKGGSGVEEETFAARLVAASLVDKDGNRLLEDNEYEKVLSWPGPVLNKISLVAMQLNGLSGRGNLNATDGEDSSLG